jgi:hypothetical protein
MTPFASSHNGKDFVRSIVYSNFGSYFCAICYVLGSLSMHLIFAKGQMSDVLPSLREGLCRLLPILIVSWWLIKVPLRIRPDREPIINLLESDNSFPNRPYVSASVDTTASGVEPSLVGYQ